MVEYKIDAIPFEHQDMDKWRENFVGVTTLHEETNLHLFGAVDDVWINTDGELIVVDYKATAKNAEITLDAEWQNMYKRQMEIYQWLLRQNGFKVNDTGYFVYTNGRMDLDGFFDKVEFRTKIIAHKGDDSWVEPTIKKMKKCMDDDKIPAVGKHVMDSRKPCEFCDYAKKRTELTIDHIKKASK